MDLEDLRARSTFLTDMEFAELDRLARKIRSRAVFLSSPKLIKRSRDFQSSPYLGSIPRSVLHRNLDSSSSKTLFGGTTCRNFIEPME